TCRRVTSVSTRAGQPARAALCGLSAQSLSWPICESDVPSADRTIVSPAPPATAPAGNRAGGPAAARRPNGDRATAARARPGQGRRGGVGEVGGDGGGG